MAEENIKLYNVNDGLVGRDGGPYLDEVEAEQAEIARAKREGRKPVLEKGKVPTYVGEQLVSGASLLARGLGTPVPSREDVESTVFVKNATEVLDNPKREIKPLVKAEVKAEDTKTKSDDIKIDTSSDETKGDKSPTERKSS